MVALLPGGGREGLSDRRDRSYLWGYGHYGIFAALAALGAGLEVAVEQSGHHVAASPLALGFAVAIPVAAYLALLCAAHALVVPGPVIYPAAVPACVAVILLPLATPRIGMAAVVAAITAICVLLVAVTITTAAVRARAGERRHARGPGSSEL